MRAQRWAHAGVTAGIAALLGACSPASGATTPSGAGATASPSSFSLPSACVSGAQYCATFANGASKWPAANTNDYFLGADSYLGGSYRMVERAGRTATALAPVDASDISQDYSVQVDVDAVLGSRTSSGGEIGIVCWDHPVSGDPSGADSAFLFFVGADSAQIVLWDNVEGKNHQIATSKPNPGLIKTDGVNHLTATCIQGSSDGAVAAQLALSVNGRQTVSVTYELNVHNYGWSVAEKDSAGNEASRLGLLVSGTNADVFYKNFSVSSKCQPGGDFPCPSPSPS